MGRDILPYEPYHPHFAYTLLITLISWNLVFQFSRDTWRSTPQQRATLYCIAIILPVYAEVASYAIFYLRPAPDTFVGYWLTHLHIWFVEPLHIDWFLSQGALLTLLGIVGLLVCGSLVELLVVQRRLRQELTEARPLAESEYAPLLADLRRVAPAHRLPAIALLPHPAPLAFTSGVLRPQIYVTTGLLRRLEGDERLAVICHELAHIIRRDTLLNTAVRVVRNVGFVLPGRWSLWRAMMVSQDEACDRMAAELTKQPLTLARALVKVATAWQQYSGPTMPIVMISAFVTNDDAATRRVEQMLQLDTKSVPQHPRAAIVLMVALLIAAVLPVLMGS